MFAFWLMIWLPTFVAITITLPYYEHSYCWCCSYCCRYSIAVYTSVYISIAIDLVCYVHNSIYRFSFSSIIFLSAYALTIYLVSIFLRLFSLFVRQSKVHSNYLALQLEALNSRIPLPFSAKLLCEFDGLYSVYSIALPRNKLLATCQLVKETVTRTVISERWCTMHARLCTQRV